MFMEILRELCPEETENNHNNQHNKNSHFKAFMMQSFMGSKENLKEAETGLKFDQYHPCIQLLKSSISFYWKNGSSRLNLFDCLGKS